MKAYELLFFVAPNTDEETRAGVMKRIDVTITPEDGEPIYTGKRLPTSSFSIVPKTPGKYTVTISGENASGYAHVYVEGAVHYDDEPAENK